MVFSSDDRKVDAFSRVIFGKEELNKISKRSDIKSIRMLGVYLDQNLSFKLHFQQMLSKVSKSFFIIRRSSNILTANALKLLYFALIHSHLNFSAYFLHSLPKKLINKIETIQKKVLRYITGRGYLEHTSQIFREFNILPFSRLIEFNILKFMCQYNSNKLPVSFLNEWPMNSNIQTSYNLRNSAFLNIPRTKKAGSDRLIFFFYARIWEEEGRNVSGGVLDMRIFEPSLKSMLLANYIAEKRCSIENCYSCLLTEERSRRRIQDLLSQN